MFGAIFSNLGQKKEGDLSAYSVFNKGFTTLLGQSTGQQFDNEIRHNNHDNNNERNNDSDGENDDDNDNDDNRGNKYCILIFAFLFVSLNLFMHACSCLALHYLIWFNFI